jgi:8-oxo-dGTP pyrophosphatase MutT (NUDIX family)
MSRSIKIYRDDHCIIISDDPSIAYNIETEFPYLDILSHPTNALLLHKMTEFESKNDHSILIISENIDEILVQLCSLYTVIEAAGGVIENEQGEILFIYRRKKWDLPKGKMEQNESASVAAIREIQEETGVSNLTLLCSLGQTYHIYEAFGLKVFKITHWFHFSCRKEQMLKPQLEEDITKIEWFHKLNATIPLNNTFGTIKDLLLDFQRSKVNL